MWLAGVRVLWRKDQRGGMEGSEQNQFRFRFRFRFWRSAGSIMFQARSWIEEHLPSSG